MKFKMSENMFSLNWKNFETNMTKALKDLREANNFFDVTIVCEDSQIQAHKVILSACSTFFRNILCHNPHQHPLLYLKDVKYKHFLAILDFMYNGEVHVVQEELKQFLAVAADLKVQGLTQKMNNPATPSKKVTVPEPKKDPEHLTFSLPIALNTPSKQNLKEPPDNISSQSVAKESSKAIQSPVKKAPQSQTPRKLMQDIPTPATPQTPKILEKCILEADIPTQSETASILTSTDLTTKTAGVDQVGLLWPENASCRWQCQICGKVFLSQDEICRHLVKHHHIYKSTGILNNMKRIDL